MSSSEKPTLQTTEPTLPTQNANQPMQFAAMYMPVIKNTPPSYGTLNTFTINYPTICSMLFSLALIWINVMCLTAKECYKVTKKTVHTLTRLILFLPASVPAPDQPV
eukprot:3396074-Rhodomonas_salina.1